MKRILFFFSNTLIGGAETNILKISDEITKQGYDVFFASLEDNGPLLNSTNLENSYLNIGLYHKNPVKSYARYKAFLIKNKIDIVSAFGLRVDFFVRLFTKRINPSIKVISNIRASENWRKPWHSYIDTITSKNVDIWVSNSISAANTFIKREKINSEKVKIIYNFIDPEAFTTPPSVINGRLKLGVLANYKKSKGHFNLIPIAQLLIQRNINFEIICAGYDYTNGTLQKVINEAGLTDKIILQGYIKDKTTFLRNINVFLLPSYIEGLPTSMIEAMAHAVPIVASNVDGIPEAIENEYNGFIVDPNDFEGFVKNIEKLQSEAIREKAVHNSFIVLNEKFNKKKNLNKWIQTFESLKKE